MDNTLLSFPVQVYALEEKYNDVLSKARCRIFYKYENRNGTYISDEFAEKLLSTLPYVPVKGIYDTDDFTDHGEARDEGRIYGIVPENPNVKWEKHLDEDGVEREYACADVLIFTALYEEAKEIVGKAQSMELYEPSIRYHFGIYGNQKYVVFDDGCFLGLQALGSEVEPCFEGASFYELQDKIGKTIKEIEQYSLLYSLLGGQKMPEINFKLSDQQKYRLIWQALNPNYNEEGNWSCEYTITDIYADYALVYDFEHESYWRYYYTQDDEQDSITLSDPVKTYVVDVIESEKAVLDELHRLNNSTYENVNQNLANAEQLAQENKDFSLKIEELNNTIATLNKEAETKQVELDSINTEYAALKDEVESINNEYASTKDSLESLNSEYTAMKDSIAALTSENEELINFKKSVELQQKKAVIEEYAQKLSNEVLTSYNDNLDNYSVIDLDKELAYELKKANLSAFDSNEHVLIPKEQPLTGIDAILSRYEK